MTERGEKGFGELSEIIAAFSHELNQPLSSISLTAQGLQFSLDNALPIPEDELRTSLALVVEQADRIASLVEHVRSLCEGVASASRESVDLRSVVDCAAELCAAQLRSRGGCLEVRPALSPIKVVANPHVVEGCLIKMARLAGDAVARTALDVMGAPPPVVVFSVRQDESGLTGRIEVATDVPGLRGDNSVEVELLADVASAAAAASDGTVEMYVGTKGERVMALVFPLAK